jgi:acetyl-CoA C-acetyltransferase
MSDVIIAGVGQTAVGEHWDLSLRDLAFQAIEAALDEAGGLIPQTLYVANMLAPVLSHQSHLGALIADYAGFDGIEAYTIEAGSASGGAALRQAFIAVSSGMVDVAMVLGVEKFTDQLGTAVEAGLSISLDSDFEAVHGLTPAAQAALLMRRYMVEYNLSHDAFAPFAMIAHANGAGNPQAMYRKAITIETYQKGGVVADPINMFDVAPEADGAAAVLLTRADLLPPSGKENGSPPLVRISGSSTAVDTLALHDRHDILHLQAARLSIERACRQAGMLPSDADFFEFFDSSSILAALSLEAAGLCARGQGCHMVQSGSCNLTGKYPILTMGGMKARGNPGGAAGVYQAVEATLQLRGQAGKNQVANARRGLIQCLGGAATTAVTHVLERI